MAQGNLSTCLPVVLAYEGGLSMIRSDPGNWTGGKVGVGELRGTNFGIAASAHPTLDIAHLTKADAAAIYDRDYWTPAGCEKLPPGLDLCHFDGTVNSGRGNSAKWLAAASRETGAAAIRAYGSARLHSLENFKAWATFRKGWSARVAGVEARALAMDGAGGDVIAAAATRSAATAKTASAVAHAAAAVTGAGAVAATSHPALGALAALVAALGAIVGAFHAATSGARAAVLAHLSTAP